MIYTFKSPATGNLIMLQPHGDRILQLIGKEPGAQGIILPEQMPAALASLDAALADERRQQSAEHGDAGNEGDRADAGGSDNDPVSLRQRAKPFMDMLRRSQDAGKPVVWGV